jgi:2,5-diketo-D-gluconate reductase A
VVSGAADAAGGAAPHVPSLTLNTGRTIPQLGFGVFLIPPEETQRLVEAAFEAGYRHIDAASSYGNEEGVGAAIAASGIPRDELFITTKLWNDRHEGDEPQRSFDESLDRLGLEHVDLFLIHWPLPERDNYVHAWHALEQIAASGRARSIGVSNFEVEHLERLAAESGTVPAVDQVEAHPAFQQRGLRPYLDRHDIRMEAWSPLGRGRYALLDEAPVVAAARAHEKSPAQIVLRWHIQRGHIVFPKSGDPARVRENIDIFGFALSPDEAQAITDLERDGRVGRRPAEVND